MRQTFAMVGAAALLATPLHAAPGDLKAAAGTKAGQVAANPRPQTGATAKSQASTAKTNYQSGQATRPAPASGTTRPVTTTGTNSKNYNANRPVNTNRPVNANNTVVTGNTVVVPANNRYNNGYNNGYNNRYPVYQTPNGGYYRPPNGGYYRPPPPPPGGWGGGYYPPPGYYYDDGPSVGDVIAGVAVTGTLLYVLSQATKPKQQTTTVVQGGPPPMPPPPQPYVPPKNSTGAPAKISVDFGGLTPEARPSASVCIAEASRQIGATGGTEIRIDRIVDVEPGNGGYRFRVNLLGVYPDETRMIPMYCRATPEKIVELTFG